MALPSWSTCLLSAYSRRFHLVAKMNKPLDEVRAGESRRMARNGQIPLLKDLMLAHSERMEPQNFLQLRMVSLSLATGSRHDQWNPVATATLRRRSNLMPITVPNYNRKT